MTRAEQRFNSTVKMLDKYYKEGLNSVYVQKPMAWALYQTWKEIDRKERVRCS